MKAYPEYKETSIDWLGTIPSHWGTVPLKYVCYMKGRIGWQGLTQAEFTDEGPYLITGMNFKNGKMNWDECYHISEERFAEAPEIHVQEHDVLITKDGTIGKLLFMDYLPGPTSLNSHLLILRPRNNEFASKYLYYLLHSDAFLRYVDNVKTGTTFYGISQASMGDFRMLIFDKAEQQAITDFLDRKTAQIDDLIAKKQRQIDLLHEQRTALINQAVTGKLDLTGFPKPVRSGQPMKDSGVEWLGEMPSHWEIRRLKFLGKIRYGLGQPPKELENGIPIIRATNIERGKFVSKDMLYVDPADVPSSRNPYLVENEIIVVRSGAYTADSAIITKEYAGAIAGYDMVITPTAINAKLLSYALLSHYVLKNQLYLERMRAAQPHLNAEELGETFIVFPSHQEEQEEIAMYLDNITKSMLDTKDRITKQIELLQEYRTALISAAVTGEIDVREG